MKYSILLVLIASSFLFVKVALAVPVKFEGLPRACAGGIENEVHQFQLTIKGLRSRQKVNWKFEGITRRDDRGAPLKTPRLFDGKWRETISLSANDKGQIRLKVLSGQAVEQPFLVGKTNGKVIAKLRCDFDAPELIRRFPERMVYHEGQWSPPNPDNGFLFDDDLYEPNDSVDGKVYLKFRIDKSKGDIDGNWRVVNGHQMRFGINRVGFNSKIIRSDHAPVKIINAEKETNAYAFISPRTQLVTSKNDGAASFVMIAGPKYEPDPDDFAGRLPEIVANVEDKTIFYQPLATSNPLVSSIQNQGQEIEWLAPAQKLRGQLLLRSSNNNWKIFDFDGINRRENTLKLPAIEGGQIQWAASGSRFRVSYSTMDGYHPGFYLFERRGIQMHKLFQLNEMDAFWSAWSPQGRSHLFERGSFGVSGGQRMSDDDPALYVWNGLREIKLPVDSSFHDVAFPRAVWNGENEIFVSLRGNSINPNTKVRGEPRIVRVSTDGTKAKTWMEKAWNPLISPDGKLVAFFGPESSHQKPSQYWIHQPLDQSLCVSRMDKKPFPDRKFGYKQRRPLGRFDTQYPWLFWSRDSKFIYAARAVAEEGNPFVDVWRFNVADGTRTLLTRFEYAISKDEEPSSIDWSFHGLSADGNSLLLIFNQPRSVQQWFRINLVNGKLEKLAIFRDCLFAWQDRSES